MNAKLIAQTPDGPVREGDYVRYHGSILGLYGQILEAVRYTELDGIVLHTATRRNRQACPHHVNLTNHRRCVMSAEQMLARCYQPNTRVAILSGYHEGRYGTVVDVEIYEARPMYTVQVDGAGIALQRANTVDLADLIDFDALAILRAAGI